MTERATGALVPDEVIEGMIDRLRARIDECDKQIASLAQQRQWLSAAIRRQKQRINQPNIDLTRERDVTAHYVAALGTMGSEIANAVLHYSKDLKVSGEVQDQST